MKDLGRSVAAYHPEILVRRAGGIVAIKADLDDWYEDGEVISKLAAANPKCRTVGELVEAIEGESFRRSPGVMACCISESEASTQAAPDVVREWDEPI